MVLTSGYLAENVRINVASWSVTFNSMPVVFQWNIQPYNASLSDCSRQNRYNSMDNNLDNNTFTHSQSNNGVFFSRSNTNHRSHGKNVATKL